MTSARKTLLATAVALILAIGGAAYLRQEGTPGSLGTSKSNTETTSLSEQKVLEAPAPAPDGQPPDSAAIAPDVVRSPITPGALLPTEHVFLRDGSLNAAAAERSLRSETFLRDLRQLDMEATASPAALAMTADYREALETQLRASGVDTQPDAFACGMSLCMGQLDGDADASVQERWWSDLVENDTVPHSIAVRHVVPNDRGGSEVRFMLVSDPAAAGVLIPYTPPARPSR